MEDVGDGEEELVGDRVLPQLPVDVGADGQGRGLGELVSGHQAGAHGGEPVQPLAEVPLLVPRLEVPGGDVVDDGVPKDVVEGVGLRHVLGVPAQDHRQLGLIVQAVHQVEVAGDGRPRAGAGGGPLGEVDRLALPGEGGGVELLGLGLVGPVVHPQADHVLPGVGDGGQDGHVPQGKLPPPLGRPGQDLVPVVRGVHEQVVHGLVRQGGEPPRLGFQADQGPVLPGYGVEFHGCCLLAVVGVWGMVTPPPTGPPPG